MKSIFLTGFSGFVGKNLISKFNGKYKILRFRRNSIININQDIVIHLAGIAHDTSNKLDSKIYYKTNTDLTIQVFDNFLKSNASDFIFLSSVKAVRDSYNKELGEKTIEIPKTDYGKSKLKAEQYILSKKIPKNKRVFILRPCMIYGPGNKGNLNLLYNIVSRGIPWPLGNYNNKRSFCSVNNLIFVIDQLITSRQIFSGVYNISDTTALSTNKIIELIYKSKNRKPLILKIPKKIISILARIGDFTYLPLNTERLNKLTSSYVVCNKKILKAINKKLPEDSKSGLLNVFENF
ncbi:NAD-dependent epimerase/dehydratase family protein [Flavobacteriaceae bacterium]|jgi:nucleoside-diphosphate-sugar epimerase|nr:NAD-dependent epimerase/dehydratase family protein [Flavobacteriaceae bacterium]